MSPQGILTLAKQGDPTAIAHLLNRSTHPHGIEVTVKRRNHYLYVLLEAPEPPNQYAATAFVRSNMKILRVELIRAVLVYGRQSGSPVPAWQQAILLDSFDSPPSPGRTVTQSPSSFTQSSGAIVPNSTYISPDGRSTSYIDPSDEASEFLKRPESVIFLILTSLLVLWDVYLALLEEVDSNVALTSKQLAQRLGTSKRTLRRMKRQPGFSQWAQSLDPENVAWVYQGGVYLPQA